MRINLNDTKTLWQQAAGDTNRNYIDICLKWGVILNGPGDCGSWPDCIETLKNSKISAKKIADLRRFCEEMKDGDIVVLRLGTGEVYAVGEIVGSYGWSKLFADIDGWDLQHFRRVRWLWASPKDPEKFPRWELKMGDTTQKLISENAIEWLKNLEIEKTKMEYIPKDLPKAAFNVLSYNEISDYLFSYGVSSQIINGLLHEITELTRIANWYKNQEKPLEEETKTYLVIPLLRALGWTPQRMAVQWNSIDVALFDKLPRENQHLSVVVEVKRKDDSCFIARSQAQEYADKRGSRSCQRLIVTDGLRYGIYVREGDTFASMPSAYLNLVKLQRNYPVYNCFGACEAFRLMNPDWSK